MCLLLQRIRELLKQNERRQSQQVPQRVGAEGQRAQSRVHRGIDVEDERARESVRPDLRQLDSHFTKPLLRLCRGARVAQSVKRPTLDFGSGHDLTVCGFEPRV